MSSQPIENEIRHRERKGAYRERIGELTARRKVSIVVSPQVLAERAEVVETMGVLTELNQAGAIQPQDFKESTQALQRQQPSL